MFSSEKYRETTSVLKMRQRRGLDAVYSATTSVYYSMVYIHVCIGDSLNGSTTPPLRQVTWTPAAPRGGEELE